MTHSIISFEPNMPVLDVSEVIQLEKRTAETGTSLLTLMSRAGSAVAKVASEMLREGDSSEKKVVILAGSGNNGGDGWVAAENLAAMGYDVTLVSKFSADELTTEPARSAAISAAQRGSFMVDLSPTQDELGQLLIKANLIIDAILGTGFAHSEVRAPYNEWIDLANATSARQGIPVLAIDCPSGLNAQTGVRATSCIEADETITMIAAKTGLIQKVASPNVGTLFVAPIGVEI